MYRLRQAAILSWWKERAWEEVVLVTVSSSTALLSCFKLCIDWVMLQPWSWVEKHASNAQILNSIKPQGYRMNFLGLMIRLA